MIQNGKILWLPQIKSDEKFNHPDVDICFLEYPDIDSCLFYKVSKEFYFEDDKLNTLILESKYNIFDLKKSVCEIWRMMEVE